LHLWLDLTAFKVFITRGICSMTNQSFTVAIAPWEPLPPCHNLGAIDPMPRRILT
jgi:hypothetical protein